jgi:hypothetical protein
MGQKVLGQAGPRCLLMHSRRLKKMLNALVYFFFENYGVKFEFLLQCTFKQLTSVESRTHRNFQSL